MSRRILQRIRAAIRGGAYDMIAHAVDEMAEDALDLVDVETAVLNGRLVRTQKDDPRGVRHTVHGTAADGMTGVGTVGRFTETGRYLIVTVYRVARSA